MKQKRGLELSLNAVIIGALGLIVLIVLVVIFTGKIGKAGEGADSVSESMCASISHPTWRCVADAECSKKADGTFNCKSGEVCCEEKKNECPGDVIPSGDCKTKYLGKYTDATGDNVCCKTKRNYVQETRNPKKNVLVEAVQI